MSGGRGRPVLLAMILGLALAGTCSAADADRAAARPVESDPADSANVSGAATRQPAGLSRRDLVFAGVTGAALAGAFATDQRLQAWVADRDTPPARRFARAAEHLGNPLVVAPALVSVDLMGRFALRPAFAVATERIAVSTSVGAVAALAIKEIAGRARPEERPGDPDDTRAFSGWSSFPSGHATVAFALAASLDAETHSRWVPWVAYPVAAAVGWSRVHDRRHWPSDVVAGAALGGWLGHHLDIRLRERWRQPLHVGVLPDGRGMRMRALVRF